MVERSASGGCGWQSTRVAKHAGGKASCDPQRGQRRSACMADTLRHGVVSHRVLGWLQHWETRARLELLLALLAMGVAEEKAPVRCIAVCVWRCRCNLMVGQVWLRTLLRSTVHIARIELSNHGLCSSRCSSRRASVYSGTLFHTPCVVA